ncbi:CCA tRNA nucleotidyltransferase [Bacillus songklensis]|uniref:CCA-adding enzyme n=1 Tax=Bacillus songklensis TaxID=1069116 RepID=A0ABV8B1S8_9BACI
MEKPFIDALPIIEKLEQTGYEAYFVGGAVRDSIIGRPIGDVDIATSAKPDQVMRLFEKTILVGIEHGTVVVVYNEIPYEVTTFRTEGTYEDFRRPSSVTFVSSLKEDLQRRDFTVNAIAMNKEGHIMDPFGGRSAIERRVIETVGQAAERFHEDALRMMRAIRFVSQLGFLLEEETKTAIIEHGHLLKHVSIERIAVEFEKMMGGQKPQTALALLIETNLYQHLPGFSLTDEMKRTISICKWQRAKDITESWAMMLILLKVKETASFLRQWKLPNKRIKDVQAVVDGYYEMKKRNWDRQAVYQYGLETALHINQVNMMLSERPNEEQSIQALYKELPIHSLKELAVNGKDLMAICKRKGGPWLSLLLQTIERKVVDKELPNNREAIKEWLQSCNQILDEPC